MALLFCEKYSLNKVALSFPLSSLHLTLKLHHKKLDSKLEVYQEL